MESRANSHSSIQTSSMRVNSISVLQNKELGEKRCSWDDFLACSISLMSMEAMCAAPAPTVAAPLRFAYLQTRLRRDPMVSPLALEPWTSISFRSKATYPISLNSLSGLNYTILSAKRWQTKPPFSLTDKIYDMETCSITHLSSSNDMQLPNKSDSVTL